MSSIHDFDFLIGDWTVANRRLRKRGVGSDDWDTFPATLHVEQWLEGVVNIDQIDFPTRGFSGLTLRSFDLATKQWSIYWINSTRGVVEPPVVGAFDGDRGEFQGDDLDGGIPIRVVFTWTVLGPGGARWEQAFSTDGETWETNWIMEMTRVSRTYGPAADVSV